MSHRSSHRSGPVLSIVGLVASLALLTTLRAEEPPSVPAPLPAHGFGAKDTPVDVEFIAPIGESEDHPRWIGTGKEAPAGTRWRFEDPTPVWRALAGARTRTFLEGRYPGANARIRITVHGGEGRRALHLHYRPGEGDLSVRAPDGTRSGGAWSFDPTADRALVALLSRTTPTAIGSRPVWTAALEEVEAPEASGSPSVNVLTLDDFARVRAAPADAYRGRTPTDLDLPEGFDPTQDLLVHLRWPARTPSETLDGGRAEIVRGVLRWTVAVRPDDDAPATSHLLAVFRPPAPVTRLQVAFGDRATVDVPLESAGVAPGPVSRGVLCRIERRAPGDASTLTVHGDGHALWERPGAGGAARRVTTAIPAHLFVPLRASVQGGEGLWSMHLGTASTVVAPGTTPPPVVADVFAWLEGLLPTD